jgi:hypothetical protein
MGRHSSKRSVLIYLPEDLHRWLKAKAALEGRSLSSVIEEAARGAYPDASSKLLSISEERSPYNIQRKARRNPARQA